MKKIFAIAMVIVMILAFAGCGQSVAAEDLFGKKYCYEQEGAGGEFTITIKEDGTFKYYEGAQSSHIGKGKWTLEGNTLTLNDDEGKDFSGVFVFTASAETLTFVAEDSSDFPFVKVKDGEHFHAEEIQEETYSANLETFWDVHSED